MESSSEQTSKIEPAATGIQRKSDIDVTKRDLFAEVVMSADKHAHSVSFTQGTINIDAGRTTPVLSQS